MSRSKESGFVVPPARSSLALVVLVACVAGCSAQALPPATPPEALPPMGIGDASSGDLVLSTHELGDFHDTVAALQADVGAEGRVVHVSVAHGDGATLPCGAYRLVLETPATSAFELGACEDGATPLRLAHRAALFAHDGPLPRPLEMRISALETRRTTITSGPPPKPIDVVCGIALKPSVVNMETGERVSLLPDRYSLHVQASEDVDVATSAVGWQLRGGRGLSVEYDVTDHVTGETVLRDHATLTCGDGGSTEEPESAAVLASTPQTRPSLVGGPDKHPPNVPAYVGASVLGWSLLSGGTAMLGAGVASIAGSDGPSRPSSLTRGIVLVDLAPHLLVSGLITVLVSGSKHRAARARERARAAPVAWAPYATPVAGGASVGLGGSF